MNASISALVLQVIGILTGAGIVNLILALARRRTELRKIDADTDSVALNAANVYIGTLQAGEAVLRSEVEVLKDKIEVLENQRAEERLEWNAQREAITKEWDKERAINTDALESQIREVGRFRLQLIQVRGDLEGAIYEIAELKRRADNDRAGPPRAQEISQRTEQESSAALDPRIP